MTTQLKPKPPRQAEPFFFGGLVKSLPKILCFILAIIPVILFCFVVINLAWHTRPIFQAPTFDVNHDGAINGKDYVGLKGVLSTHISTDVTGNLGQYGLIPGIWGTVLLVIIAMGIATPIALMMAIFSSEFTLGFWGRGMRALLGMLSGIPPIIYALMWIVVFEVIVVPNFRANGLFPPAGMTWYHSPAPNSTLIGGIIVAMLLIPFIAPLFGDAIRNVPSSYKEASLGLGATRWYTLVHVTLPAAFSGILSGIRLGILKTMGDVIIVSAVIGIQTNIPNPFFDVFRPIAPLSATGVGLAGGFSQSASDPIAYATANFAAILLIVMAFVIILLETMLQRRFKKRFSPNGR